MPQTVQVGDRSLVIGDFSPFKFLEASALVSELSEQFPDVFDRIAAFKSDYAVKHGPVLERATAEFQYPDDTKGISETAWERAGHVIRMPAEVPTQAVVVAMFHQVFQLSRERVTDLLALSLTPNSELKKADTEGTFNLKVATEQYRDLLMHEATLSQFIHVALAVRSQLEEEYRANEDDLGEALPFLITPKTRSGAQSQKNGRASSSGSRKRSGGRAKRPSTTSPGAS